MSASTPPGASVCHRGKLTVSFVVVALTWPVAGVLLLFVLPVVLPVVLFVLLPLAFAAWPYGPGQDHLERDDARVLIEKAEAAL